MAYRQLARELADLPLPARPTDIARLDVTIDVGDSRRDCAVDGGTRAARECLLIQALAANWGLPLELSFVADRRRGRILEYPCPGPDNLLMVPTEFYHVGHGNGAPLAEPTGRPGSLCIIFSGLVLDPADWSASRDTLLAIAQWGVPVLVFTEFEADHLHCAGLMNALGGLPGRVVSGSLAIVLRELAATPPWGGQVDPGPAPAGSAGASVAFQPSALEALLATPCGQLTEAGLAAVTVIRAAVNSAATPEVRALAEALAQHLGAPAGPAPEP